jgi:hypothetical protein
MSVKVYVMKVSEKIMRECSKTCSEKDKTLCKEYRDTIKIISAKAKRKKKKARKKKGVNICSLLRRQQFFLSWNRVTLRGVFCFQDYA